MKTYNARKATLIRFLAVVCSLSFFGCGAIITQEAAQNAVDDAQIAVQTAKDGNAETYSAANIKKAERLLVEAQQALSRKRRQRAYRLATQAEKAAKAAEEEAKQRLGIAPGYGQLPQPGEVTSATLVPRGAVQQVKPLQQPIDMSPSITYVLPGAAQSTTTLQQGTSFTPSSVPVQSDLQVLDVQNRIQAAVQALEGAQRAVQAARLLVLKIQVEIGLSMADANIQQARQIGMSKEAVNSIQSWYDQARQAAALGNYENALRLLERAQAYTQVSTMPMQ